MARKIGRMASFITGRRFAGLIIVLLATSLFPHLASAAVPSFSCDKPSAIEKSICDSEELSSKDRLLAHFFNLAKEGALGDGSLSIVQAQRKWVAERNKICGKPLDPQCISNVYDDRLFELAASDLFSDHDAAINEIARQHPKLSAIYEAIYAFATIPDAEARVRAVAPLIADAYSKNAVVPGFDIGGVHTDPRPQPLFGDIPDARAAASSADKLGAVFWVVSAYGYGDTVSPLRVPCAAIVRRPEAILWLKPRWGGAIDGRTPFSDCAETMPPLPAYAALAAKAQRREPIEGTIRFSLGASNSADDSAVMTHSLEILRKNSGLRPYESEAVKRFEKSNPILRQAAIDELEAYYQKYFGASAEEAGRDARTAVAMLLSNLLNGGE